MSVSPFIIVISEFTTNDKFHEIYLEKNNTIFPSNKKDKTLVVWKAARYDSIFLLRAFKPNNKFVANVKIFALIVLYELYEI